MAEQYCVNCGSELRPEFKFCPNCGHAATGEPPGVRASEPNELLVEATSSPFYGGGPRTIVRVFRDRVILLRLPRLGRPHQTTLRFEQIAAVNLSPGLRYANLTIETTGGAILETKGVPNAAAQEITDLITACL